MLATRQRLITITEAARLAGVSRQTIHTWLESGRLTVYRRELDNKRMIDRDELERKLGGQAEGGAV